jgi:hypothetical protein
MKTMIMYNTGFILDDFDFFALSALRDILKLLLLNHQQPAPLIIVNHSF